MVDEVVVGRNAAGRDDRVGRCIDMCAGNSGGRRGREIANTLTVHERPVRNTKHWVGGAVDDALVVRRNGKIRFIHRKHTRHVRRRIVISISHLRRRNGTRTGAGEMHERAANGAVVRNTERNRQARARCRGNAEVRIAPHLIRKRAERNRLICFADM